MSDVEAGRGRGQRSILVYGPLVVGLALLVLGRVTPDFRGSIFVASALLLMALSCFIYAAFPGSGEITDQQRLLLGQLGVDYRPSMGRIANVLLGLLLCLGGLAFLIR